MMFISRGSRGTFAGAAGDGFRTCEDDRGRIFPIVIESSLLGSGARSAGGKLGKDELHVKASGPSLVGLSPRAFTRPDALS